MFLIIDKEGNLTLYSSVEEAEQNMETNDFYWDEDEFEMCDDSGLRYTAQILDHPSPKWSADAFEIVPTDTRDPRLPSDFLSRTRDFRSHVRELKTLNDAVSYFSRRS